MQVIGTWRELCGAVRVHDAARVHAVRVTAALCLRVHCGTTLRRAAAAAVRLLSLLTVLHLLYSVVCCLHHTPTVLLRTMVPWWKPSGMIFNVPMIVIYI